MLAYSVSTSYSVLAYQPTYSYGCVLRIMLVKIGLALIGPVLQGPPPPVAAESARH